MAMNKKEQAAFAALQEELRLAKVTWRYDAPQPEKIPPPSGGAFTEGWDFNAYTGRVYEAWSEFIVHGTGRYPRTREERLHRGASQRGVSLYATRIDALIALRHAKTEEFARALAAIDAKIEKERAALTERPEEAE